MNNMSVELRDQYKSKVSNRTFFHIAYRVISENKEFLEKVRLFFIKEEQGKLISYMTNGYLKTPGYETLQLIRIQASVLETFYKINNEALLRKCISFIHTKKLITNSELGNLRFLFASEDIDSVKIGMTIVMNAIEPILEN